jgi:uncharacterized membrane protein HdeD (DUF308 family)
MAGISSVAASKAGARFGRAPWWVLALEGAGLIALGLIAVTAPLVASLAVTLVVGWVYMFAGGIRVVSAITHRGPSWGWSLLLGCLALAAGLILLLRPLAGLISLTIILGAFFFADAALSFVLAATVGRRSGRAVWLVTAGVADILLGAAVFVGLTAGALWLLGLVVAANLVFAGAGLLTVGFAIQARHLLEEADKRDAAAARGA